MIDALKSDKIVVLPLWAKVGSSNRPEVIGQTVSKGPKTMGKQWSKTVKPKKGGALKSHSVDVVRDERRTQTGEPGLSPTVLYTISSGKSYRESYITVDLNCPSLM